MTTKALRSTLAWLAVAVALAPAAAAQGLGDAAKKAQEQRQANAGKGIRIEMDPLSESPIRPVRLDKPAIEHYTNARIAMAKMWHRDEPLYDRLKAAVMTSRNLQEVVAALNGEPKVVEVLKLYNYTAESFLSTQLSIEQALELTQGGFDMAALSDIERANYEFMGRNRVWTGVQRGKVNKAEAGMNLWR
jgi:hypothetical protein